jgi:hypothetical protein
LPEEKGITRRTFPALVTFQIVAALEAECGANSGIEKNLPQRLAETYEVPDDLN